MTNFKDNSAQAIKWLRQQALKAMEEATLVVESSAVNNAPVDTGALAQSINHQTMQDGARARGFVGTNQDYAMPVEFGTGEFAENGMGRQGGWVYRTPDGRFFHTTGQPPQPFLEPAFKENQENIKKIMTDNFRR